MRIKILEKW